MSRMLALSGLIASVLILMFMLVDLIVFQASPLMNIGFMIGALILGVMSFLSYRQAA